MIAKPLEGCDPSAPRMCRWMTNKWFRRGAPTYGSLAKAIEGCDTDTITYMITPSVPELSAPHYCNADFSDESGDALLDRILALAREGRNILCEQEVASAESHKEEEEDETIVRPRKRVRKLKIIHEREENSIPPVEDVVPSAHREVVEKAVKADEEPSNLKLMSELYRFIPVDERQMKRIEGFLKTSGDQVDQLEGERQPTSLSDDKNIEVQLVILEERIRRLEEQKPVGDEEASSSKLSNRSPPSPPSRSRKDEYVGETNEKVEKVKGVSDERTPSPPPTFSPPSKVAKHVMEGVEDTNKLPSPSSTSPPKLIEEEPSMENSSILSMKLLIDTESNKVLFAEVNKDCVDFLFSLLALPLATVTKLLRKQGMVGCMGNLYTSIENLSKEYIQPGKTKYALLNPTLPACDTSFSLLQLQVDKPFAKNFYMCNGNRHEDCNKYVTDDSRAICPNCSGAMTLSKTYAAPPKDATAWNAGGFVKAAAMYMLRDDLMVEPLSMISSIALLNKLNVQNLTTLQDRVVNLTMTKAVMLLKASLCTDQVLTQVFVKGSNAS